MIRRLLSRSWRAIAPRSPPLRSMSRKSGAGPALGREPAPGTEARPDPMTSHADGARRDAPARRSQRMLWIAAAALNPAAGVAACADVALVLAVDASGSVAPDEFALQMRGYAAAFRHPAVLRAIESAGRVEVAAIVWGDSRRAPQTVGWRRLDGPADAAALALSLETGFAPVGGNTGLGDGLWASLDLIEQHGRCAHRSVVNVSGDGRETASRVSAPRHSVVAARERATRGGVTVNALAILGDEPELSVYFESALITGPDAFVMEAASFRDFADAIVRKLEREIAPSPVAALSPAPPFE